MLQSTKNMHKTRTIYMIENTSNGKKYIGISMNYERRRKYHLYTMKKGIHANSHIQKDYNEGKIDDFVFAKLKDVDGLLESMKEESLLMEKYDTVKNGYNVIENARPLLW